MLMALVVKLVNIALDLHYVVDAETLHHPPTPPPNKITLAYYNKSIFMYVDSCSKVFTSSQVRHSN